MKTYDKSGRKKLAVSLQKIVSKLKARLKKSDHQSLTTVDYFIVYFKALNSCKLFQSFAILYIAAGVQKTA